MTAQLQGNQRPTLPVSRQKERSRLSDERMVSEAILLLSRGGEKAVTLEAVGEQAGYSRGLVTRRYGSKAQLLVRVLEVLNTWMQDQVHQATQALSGLAAIERTIDKNAELIKAEPDRMRAMFLLWFYGLFPESEFRSSLYHVHKSYMDNFRTWLVEGQATGEVRTDLDSEQAAELIFSLISGIVHQWLLDPERPTSELHGLGKSHIRMFVRAKVSETDAAG